MRRKLKKGLKWSGSLLLAFIGINMAAIPFVMPTLTALICPSCYDFERLNREVHVEQKMSREKRVQLLAAISKARKQVASYYGQFDRPMALLVCDSAECDKKLGGRGSKATVYTTIGFSFVRVAPAFRLSLHLLASQPRLLSGISPPEATFVALGPFTLLPSGFGFSPQASYARRKRFCKGATTRSVC